MGGQEDKEPNDVFVATTFAEARVRTCLWFVCAVERGRTAGIALVCLHVRTGPSKLAAAGWQSR